MKPEASKPSITAAAAYLVRTPLKRPYKLAFGSLESFESVFVRIKAGDREGAGEATGCPGYYHQGLEDAWRFVIEQTPLLIGRSPDEALGTFSKDCAPPSFATSALIGALEDLNGIFYRSTKAAEIPLVGIVQEEEPASMASEIERLQQEGYRTLKLKVGFSVAGDLERVRRLKEHLQEDVLVRLDANQGWDYAEAKRFLEGLDPSGIELLEQPLKPDRWEEMARLAECSPVPLMLDEAIASPEDLRRAIEMRCAEAVKFKLMKCGGAGELRQMIDTALGAGLKVIVGNGIATDIGCLQEALVSASAGLADHAGEMNGFLKAQAGFLDPPLRLENGRLRLDGKRPSIAWERISGHALDTRLWGDINAFG